MKSLPTAVILLAGRGSRLMPLTHDHPKCLVEVAGKTIVERALEALAECGISRAVLVVGYLGDLVCQRLGDSYGQVTLSYVHIPEYATTNNLVSLWGAREHLHQDILLLEGDVVFEAEVARRLLRVGNAMAVAPFRSWHGGTTARRSETGQIQRVMLSDEAPGELKTVNLYGFEKAFLEESFLPALEAEVEAGNVHAFYESVLRQLVKERPLHAVDVGDLLWCEVDDGRDLELAHELFAPAKERYQRIRGLHGGHWRHLVTDHAYLYNLYFPPPEFLAEFHNELDVLVRDYPVGQAELARLAEIWLGLPASYLVVANGAAELIKILGRLSPRGWTVPVPSFNEFEFAVSSLHPFLLPPPNFDLDPEAFVRAGLHSGTGMAVIVSPNNPTSRSVSRSDLLAIARGLAQGGCRLIVDESFSQFSRAGSTWCDAKTLTEHPNVALLKSMSKEFGVAGLRLGYLASADAGWVQAVRRELPVWNVNGLGEAFWRSLPRYREAFESSCLRVRQVCDEFYAQLTEIGLEPLVPDANFVLCRLPHFAPSSSELAWRLFYRFNILVKDCEGKSMAEGDRYLRLASRTPLENQRLIAAIKQCLDS